MGDFNAFFGACLVYEPFISVFLLLLLLAAHFDRDDDEDDDDDFDVSGADTTEMCTWLACAWIGVGVLDRCRIAPFMPLFCSFARRLVGFLIFMALISLGIIGRNPSSVPLILKKKMGAVVDEMVGVANVVGLMVVDDVDVDVLVVDGDRRPYGLLPRLRFKWAADAFGETVVVTSDTLLPYTLFERTNFCCNFRSSCCCLMKYAG